MSQYTKLKKYLKIKIRKYMQKGGNILNYTVENYDTKENFTLEVEYFEDDTTIEQLLSHIYFTLKTDDEVQLFYNHQRINRSNRLIKDLLDGNTTVIKYKLIKKTKFVPVAMSSGLIGTSSNVTGTMRKSYPDDSIYYGDFVKGKRHGKGRLEFPNGSYYEGEWENNKMSGKGKEMLIFDTHTEYYEGEFLYNNFYGVGTLKFDSKLDPNDSFTYVGNFVNNLYHGNGKLTRPNQSYNGEWEMGEKQGYGIHIYTSLDDPTFSYTYKGDFVDNMMDGAGEYNDTTGQTFIGLWKNDEYYKGTLTNTFDGKTIKRIGEFKNNLLVGKGKLEYSDGSYYDGMWQYGRKNGNGIELFSNGDKFTGRYYMDNIVNGTMEYPKGNYYSSYTGDFKYNMFHGKGKLIYSDGRIEEGTFEDGDFTI
jgi:hypothetical protein